MKYTPIDDEKEFKRLTEAVKANGGYCPCIIARNEDTRCPCKHFLERSETGKALYLWKICKAGDVV